MKNNKKALLVELKEKLGCSEEECLLINSIAEEYFIFKKKNKPKIVNEFEDKLNVSEERAEEIYDVFMNIVKERIKFKIFHPFKNKDKHKKAF